MINLADKINALCSGPDYYKCVELLFAYDLESLGIEPTEEQYRQALKIYSELVIEACDQAIDYVSEQLN